MIQDDISISYKYNEWIPFRHGIENHPSVFFVLFTESPMRTWDDLRCSTVSSTWPSSRPRPSRQVLPWLGHQKIAVGQPPNLQRRPFLRWGSQGLYDIIWSWCIMMWSVYLISGPFSQNRDFAHRNTSRWGQWRVNLGQYCGPKKKNAIGYPDGILQKNWACQLDVPH